MFFTYCVCFAGQLDAYLSEKRVGDGLSLIYPDYLEKLVFQSARSRTYMMSRKVNKYV